METLECLDIRTYGGTKLQVVKEFPSPFRFTAFPMAENSAILSPIVTAIYQHLPGDQFDIWIGDYFGHRRGTVRTRGALETVELSIAWVNRFDYNWKGIGRSGAAPMQFTFAHSPHLDITTSFEPGIEYRTIDFHFTKTMFEHYAVQFPGMGRFLKKMRDHKTASLPIERSVTPSMRQTIQSLLNLECKPVHRMDMMKNRAEEILMFALEAVVQEKQPSIRAISGELREKVQRAARLLDHQITVAPTIAQLAEMVESNARSLQFGFQACFACTVYEYVKRRKLELAKVILATTGDTMNEVADQVGYNDGPYLINAFRTAFGMTPEEYRKEAQKRKSN